MAEATSEVPPDKEERRAAIVISPEDVSGLAAQLNDVAGIWDLFVGQLGVPRLEQQQISRNNNNHPAFAQICLVDGLQYWVVSDPSPTVEKVIAALSSRTINNKLLAAEIARKWGIQAFVENPAPELRSICTAASQLAITRPDSQLLFDKLQAEVRSSELRNCFISLVGDLKQHLKETKTDAGLPKFRDEFILKLPLSVREDNEKFFDQKNGKINKTVTFDELFTCLSTYWSYLNHSLLGGIILRYGTEELKDNIKAFSREVDEFRKVTTIEIFQEIEPPPRVVPPAGFQEFVTKHALSLTSTLEDIECIRHEFCETFHLHKFAFYLVRVLKGSVLITWLVPHSVARLLEAGMTQEVKKALHIEDIMYADTKSSNKKDDATPFIEARLSTSVASFAPAKATTLSNEEPPDDATPFIEASTSVASSAQAKATTLSNKDPTVPAVMVTQSVGVEVAAPRYQKTLDRVAIALLVLVSSQFYYDMRWVCSWCMVNLLPLGPFIAGYISQRWIPVFELFLLPFVYVTLYCIGIFFQVILDLVFILFGISSIYFMSALLCVSALAYLSTRYQRLREVDSLPGLFKDPATFASCVSVVYVAGICSITIAILAHAMILDGGWISLIYFFLVVFVAYSLLILMLFLHTCVSKRKLLAAWLLLTVALLAACYLMVNYLSVQYASTHSDTATAPTEEYVPVVPAIPGEGNHDPADAATAPTEECVPVVPATPGEGNQNLAVHAVPAMIVPVVVSSVFGWFFRNKWQGLIVLIVLLTYFQLNNLHPFDPVISPLWNPLVTHHGGAQLPTGVPCSFDEGVCLTPISSKIELNSALADIGDWYALCQYLGVSEAKLAELKFSNKQYAVKKRECLSAYFDLGSQKACWERVVEVVGSWPFENVRLAGSLSRRYLGCDYIQRSSRVI